MQKTITGCAIPILLFAIFFGGYAYLFLPRVEPVWLVYVLAGVGALMLSLVFGAVKTLFQTRTTAAALRRAQGMRPPQDGKFVILQGNVVAVGDAIHAPFSQTPCVSYEYHLYRVVRTNTRRETGYRTGKDVFAFGLAKTAYLIRTPRGDVHPLGYPTLDHLSKTSWLFSETSDHHIRQRVEEFLQHEHFQKAGVLGMASALSQMIGVIEDDADVVRKDWKVRDPDDLNGVTVNETRLEPGQQVCAFGKWDEERSVLHPPVELIAGDYNNAKRILIANKRSSAVFGLIFGLLASAMLLGFGVFSIQLSPEKLRKLSPEARPYRNESFQSVVQSAPAHVILEICQGYVDPNQRDTFGNPAIFWVRDADKLQALLDCGADPNLRDRDGDTKLSEAARYGDVESVRALLVAGAEIEAEIPELGRGWTAMVSAYTAGRSEVVKILKEAGAHDERVTAATGEPLTEDSAPIYTVRAYLAAIQAGNVQTMKRIRPDKSPEWFEQIDFETWKTYYPSEPTLKHGFGNARAATLELEIYMVGDYPVRRFFHLEYAAEGETTPQWLILREWDAPAPE